MFCFIVDGPPVPKQSTRFDGHGHAHTAPRVKAWQDLVSWKAKEAMTGREILTCDVAIRCVFVLNNHRRVDSGNLEKCIEDALNGIVYIDDCQIVNTHIVKHVYPKATAGVFIEIHPGGDLPPFYEVKK
jgi:Holliday junction resolvase RusA-like endonuclease